MSESQTKAILDSDGILREAADLVLRRVPLGQWPEGPRTAMNLALREKKNMTSRTQARDLLRFLQRWGIVPDPLPEWGPPETPTGILPEYRKDRLLADLLLAVIRAKHGK